MGRSSGETLPTAVARQVCLETQSRATLAGSIANQGNRYLIRLAAQDCKTGRDLTVVSAGAPSRDQVIHALGEAGTLLRTSLGDPTVAHPDFNRPLEEATTGSLDAIQEYAQGLGPIGSGDPVPHLKRAVELDPNFALAYQQLARHYMAFWQSQQSAESFTKAYTLRSRLSLRHRLGVEASYYLGASGELDKAVQTYNELIRIFPESGARNQLCFALRRQGRLEQALAVCREAVRFNRNEAFPISNTIQVYIALDRLVEAQAAFNEAQAGLSNPVALSDLGYMLAFAQGDHAAMRRYFELATAQSGVDAGGLFFLEAYTQTYYGRLEKAQQLWQRASASVSSTELPETVAGWRAREALMDAQVGHNVRATSLAGEALALSAGRDVKGTAALALAYSGYTARAQRLADELRRDFPRDTLLQSYELPLIRASIELHNHHPAKAVEALQAAVPYELAFTPLFPNVLPPYMRAEAYLQSGQGKQAAAELQKVLAHPGLVGNSIHGALAHLQLGRAQAMMGDKDAARKSYQDFLTLWKNADPDIPVYQQAIAEYTNLR
jgi:tetratricopeptide (TPR) repeat protein